MKNFKMLYLLLMVAFLWFLSVPGQAHALLASHDCSFCHDFHGGPGYSQLLVAENSELVCLTCHTVSINSTKAAAAHNPQNLASNQQGYITCRECHNPHDNIGSNIKLIGYKFDPENNQSFTVPTIREELTTSNPASPIYKEVTFTSTTAPNADFYRNDGKGSCEICHTSNHLVGAKCTACHMHENDFGGTIDPPEGFPADGECTSCHTGTGTDSEGLYSFDAYNVGSGSPHTKTTAGGSFNACTDCHPGHTATPDVVVPNYNAVGINYSANGESGIALGGTETSGSTEAEICWNCHTSSESEWNALADHGFAVTGGANWTAVSFDLDGTTVPTNSTRSIHSVNSGLAESVASSVTNNIDWSNSYGNGTNALVPHANRTLESVGDIRCSYCHDVHDLNLAANDATSGKPYLRGSWLHNPYVATDIERPPESGDSWTGNRWSHFDSGDTVPRLRTDVSSKNTAGGYQIDQNNSYPTASYIDNADRPSELDDTAGLCVLCHGTDVDSMDYFSTRNLWNSPNGHANAVLGGTGYNAVSLFDARNRDGQLSTAMGFFMAGQGADIPNIDQWGDDRPSGFGEDRKALLPYGDNASDSSQRPDEGNSSGLSATPPRYTGYYTTNAGSRRATTGLPTNYTAWYSSSGIGNNAGPSGRAHDFSCSKCHTPHASRLPALLVTNCLDYTISNWSVSASGPNGGGSVTLGPSATNRWAREAMNNCHRKKDTTTGWNVLAPQQ